ncbi:hypothetical protein BLA17378_01211 [Burkholderia aenigmatica]|uniref:Uncharacterized protein n=1 Tax=Burkholderia aenigmatica TaxID=2015348 RepID=A0ABY6XQQ5_9BURK|nr:hypothetical protein BLA17378_01211 [Burkholderia aenigmatica]
MAVELAVAGDVGGGRPTVARIALHVEFTIERHSGDAERAVQRQ